MTRDQLSGAFRGGCVIGVDLPARPLSGNRYLRLHWSKRREENRKWDMLVLAYMGPGPFKGKRMVGRKVGLILTVHRLRLQDTDNLALSLKPVIDALKKNGWMHDDSTPWLESRCRELKGTAPLVEIEMRLLE